MAQNQSVVRAEKTKIRDWKNRVGPSRCGRDSFSGNALKRHPTPAPSRCFQKTSLPENANSPQEGLDVSFIPLFLLGHQNLDDRRAIVVPLALTPRDGEEGSDKKYTASATQVSNSPENHGNSISTSRTSPAPAGGENRAAGANAQVPACSLAAAVSHLDTVVCGCSSELVLWSYWRAKLAQRECVCKEKEAGDVSPPCYLRFPS